MRPVRIAPITILVGENSTGKTSFLAGLRQMVEAFSQAPGNAFNKEPYYLGSFEQIAHYRGGRAGRARSFCLELEIGPDGEQPELFEGRTRPRLTKHRLVFTKGPGQPELSSYEVSARDILGRFDLSGGRPRILVQQPGQTDILIQPDRAPPSVLMRREIGFLGYYLQDLVMRSSRGPANDVDEPGPTEIVRLLWNVMRQSSRSMERNVFASAPVRIQPRRVYTPSELSSLNPSEQVPLEMANMKLASPDRWQQTKSKLNEFGKRSGLFEDLEVKRLGKTDSDPFQLQVKNQGPAANIVDVGYGVSQALPLLFPLQVENEYDFFLLQQPEVHLHPRAQAEFGSLLTTLSAQKPANTYVVETHSDFVVDRIRSDVRDGVVPSSSVSILLFRRQGPDVSVMNMGIDDKGEITHHPEDYREFFLREQARVLGI
jgi:hypothetical protein